MGAIEAGRIADFAAINLSAPQLACVEDENLLAALIFGCSAESVVLETCVGGSWMRHREPRAQAVTPAV